MVSNELSNFCLSDIFTVCMSGLSRHPHLVLPGCFSWQGVNVTLGLSSLKSDWTVPMSQLHLSLPTSVTVTVQALFIWDSPNVTDAGCQKKQPKNARCESLEMLDIHRADHNSLNLFGMVIFWRCGSKQESQICFYSQGYYRYRYRYIFE